MVEHARKTSTAFPSPSMILFLVSTARVKASSLGDEKFLLLTDFSLLGITNKEKRGLFAFSE